MAVVRMLVSALCLGMVAACTQGISGGGVGPGGDDGSGSPDAAAGHAIDAAAHQWSDASSIDAAKVACVEPQTGYGNGEHNTGKDCLGSCHNHGFTVAGTVYTTATNNSGYAGATITLVDANGTSYPLVVQANGNFYTSANVAFPVTVSASDCPYTTPMTAKVTQGGCNNASCHQQSGGAAGQIHLP